MTDPNICPKCGRRKKPQFDLCYGCSQKRKDSGDRGGKPQYENLPEECFFDTFLNEAGKPKKEIYIDSAEKAARAFENARTKDKQGMSQSSIRSLFQMLKSTELRISADPNISEEEVFDAFHKFVIQTEYQVKRQVIPEVFGNFVRDHTDLATSSIPEFKGFVQYLTSIVARMKTK